MKFWSASGMSSIKIKVKYPGQAWQDYTTRTFDQSISVNARQTDKVSVDTGNFTPGVYRTNPYFVYERKRVWQEPTFVVEGFNSAGTQWRFTVSGMLPASFVDTVSTLLSPINSNVSGLDKYALQKAYAKIGQNKVGVGEALGELRETLNMLRQPLSSIRKFFTDNNQANYYTLKALMGFVKNGKLDGRYASGVAARARLLTGAEAAKAAADTWLEFRYGLYPLYRLAQDLIEEATKRAVRLDPNRIRCARSTRKAEVVVNLPTTSGTTFDTILWRRLSSMCTDKITCHASVHYKLAEMPSKMDIMGLTPRFLPELAWELTRLSFVVDWWFDVGTWLGAMRFSPSCVILGNTVGTKIERNVGISAHFRIGDAYRYPEKDDYYHHNIVTYTENQYTRVKNLHLPLLPSWRPEFKSYWHLIDACALSLQPLLTLLKRNLRKK